MLKSSINWAIEKLGHITAEGIVSLGAQLEPIFIIVAMVGVFLILLGVKRLGTKLTSFSIIIYAITRVI